MYRVVGAVKTAGMYVCLCVGVCACVYLCCVMDVLRCRCSENCMYVFVPVCVRIYMCMHTYTRIYEYALILYMHAYLFYTCMHTYIHTHI
jgi:hypothetical protein